MVEADELVERFSVRAEELRGIAENVRTPELRKAMLQWADDYELFAKRALTLVESQRLKKSSRDPDS